MYAEIFVSNVVRLSKCAGWTQRDLSRRSGVSESFLSDLCHGKANPSLRVMADLAGALGIALPELLQPGRFEEQRSLVEERQRAGGLRAPETKRYGVSVDGTA